LKKEKFDIYMLIKEILGEYQQTIRDSRSVILSFKVQQDNGTIIIEADRSRLSQVVNNLISNAFKFTNEGSIQVTIEQKDSGNRIIVRIKDTGIGIHPDVLPKLFTKFATKYYTGGTGLGLFISKSIIEKHGGEIWAENNNYDGDTGATFTFSLSMDITP
jgi:signal transduction histidine kinase